MTEDAKTSVSTCDEMLPDLYTTLRRNRWGELLFVRTVPACLFASLFSLKAAHFFHYQQSRAFENSGFFLAAYTLQRGLALLFLGMMVVLFVVRRPVVNRHSSLLAGIIALCGTFLFTVGAPQPSEMAARGIGILLLSSALILIGTVVSIAGLAALGRCFGITPEARGLVVHGLYRWVRHPLYLGEIVSSLGILLIRISWPIGILFLLFCALQYWRALMEEKVLEETFPEYGEYRRRTYRLVPCLI